EPTRLQIVNAHKGLVRWYLTCLGKSCHSSRPEQGVNAIYRMAGLLIRVEQYAEALRTSRAHPRLGPPTLSVGRIEGGTSANTVADRCRVEIDRRLLPGEDPLAAPRDLQTYLRQYAQVDFPFESSEPCLRAPALGSEGSDDLVAQLGRAVDSVKGGHEV